jgi:hypothetical protein
MESDLFEAQPVTFRTMLKAKENSLYSDSILQYAIGFKEDESMIPESFIKLSNLKRSVLDVSGFTKQRKLPLIKDILLALKTIDSDYIIYTNVDIALMPHFYDYIIEKLKSGSDSLIINRRVLDSLKEDSLMYSDIGKSHPGYDCFVFRKELVSKFVLGNTCIGANWIGRIMYANLIVFSKKLEIIKDAHLTFHIGEDGAWLSNNYNEFDTFNKNEVYNSIDYLYKSSISSDNKKSLEEVLEFMNIFGMSAQIEKHKISYFKKFIKVLKKLSKKTIKKLID